mgnify:CR=1 FL=1
MVVTGQGSVTIPPRYKSRVLQGFILVGDEMLQGVKDKTKDLGTPDHNLAEKPSSPH